MKCNFKVDNKEPEFVVLRETAESGVSTKHSGWYFPLTCDTSDSTDTSLAWSMLAGPCDSYCSHFVICGLRLAAIDLKEVCMVILSKFCSFCCFYVGIYRMLTVRLFDRIVYLNDLV